MRVGSERYAGSAMRIFCVLVLMAVGCAAQENTRSISGTVIDASGASIPNAKVALSSVTTVEVKTDNQGKFMFSTLEPGSYKLQFQQTGFRPKTLDITIDNEPIVLGQVVLEVGILICPVIVGEGPAPPECSGSLCGTVRYWDLPVQRCQARPVRSHCRSERFPAGDN
jgi:Carboxypeptidase regulatory-like domain